MMKFTKNQKKIRLRLMELLFKLNYSHIGSCLGVIDLIDSVYAAKKNTDKFVLSAGHSAAAYYVILEKNGYPISNTIDKLEVHPKRNLKYDISVSTGSLGHGFPIALGMAIAKPKAKVYCLTTDGELAEGSMWETLRIWSESKVTNLRLIVAVNGWSAYDKINHKSLIKRLKSHKVSLKIIDGHSKLQINRWISTKNSTSHLIAYARTKSNQFSFLKGLDAHYHVMTDQEFKQAKNELTI